MVNLRKRLRFAFAALFVIALLELICRHAEIPWLAAVTLEYHGPRLLHAVLTDTVASYHWGNVAALAGLAGLWCSMAVLFFRSLGWQ